MQSNDYFEYGAECLDAVGCVVSWRRPKKDPQRWAPMVVIQVCSSTDESVFTPASDVTVRGKPALRALRSAIDEALAAAEA